MTFSRRLLWTVRISGLCCREIQRPRGRNIPPPSSACRMLLIISRLAYFFDPEYGVNVPPKRLRTAWRYNSEDHNSSQPLPWEPQIQFTEGKCPCRELKPVTKSCNERHLTSFNEIIKGPQDTCCISKVLWVVRTTISIYIFGCQRNSQTAGIH
jgi:hypothetical protein